MLLFLLLWIRSIIRQESIEKTRFKQEVTDYEEDY